MTSTLKTRPWDPAERRETEEDIAAHLQAAFEEGDPSLVAAALGDIARAKGMAQIARAPGSGARASTKHCPRKPTPSSLLTALRAEAEHFQVHHQPQKLSSKLLPHQREDLYDRPL